MCDAGLRCTILVLGGEGDVVSYLQLLAAWVKGDLQLMVNRRVGEKRFGK
jgi:hypothetical protein